MDLNKLEQDIAKITKHLDKDEFIYELLLAYDFPKATITRLKKGTLNKAENKGGANQEILWKRLYFVDTFEEEEEIDLVVVRQEREALKSKLADLEVEMDGYLKELGYAS
ncbi:MAG: hypothetical protein KAH22_07980 [Thiotrichaceae bacterium]|nr:hypothetical protein [Thiotrichaceae bacterium]